MRGYRSEGPRVTICVGYIEYTSLLLTSTLAAAGSQTGCAYDTAYTTYVEILWVGIYTLVERSTADCPPPEILLYRAARGITLDPGVLCP